MRDEIEFGVLVRSSRRREGIGRLMLQAFLENAARSRPGMRVVAYCDLDNRAVLRLLRSAGLQAIHLDPYTARFETVVVAPQH